MVSSVKLFIFICELHFLPQKTLVDIIKHISSQDNDDIFHIFDQIKFSGIT